MGRKILRVSRREGHDSIESLKEAYKDKIESVRREAVESIKSDPTATTAAKGLAAAESALDAKSSPSPSPASSSSSSSSSTTATSSASASKSQTPGIKPLSAFLDIDKILTLPAKEIEALWRLRHAGNPNSICACIPLETYRRIVAAARQHPQFILPLPRATQQPESEGGEKKDVAGADIHFLQWGFHPPATPPPPSQTPTANTHTSTIVFTHLASYKLHGSYAEPHTAVTHYLDLADEKGLVLMHGQVMPDRGVSVAEASWLVSCVQRFYDFGGEAKGRKGELLRMFTRGDVEGFSVEELMEEAEKIS